MNQNEYVKRVGNIVEDINQAINDDLVPIHAALPGNVVRVVPRLRVELVEFCPHCGDEIREKSVYYNDGLWYHRPCIDKGNIVFDSRPEYEDIFGG